MRKALHLASILIAFVAIPLLAQKGPIDELGFHADKLYDFSGVDSVNLFNGNLVISIPIGPRYSVSSNLSYQFTLVFNGKLWDTETWCDDPFNTGCTGPNLKSRILPNLGSNAGNGWRMSLGRLLPPVYTGRYNDSLDDDTWVYEGPAGDEHVCGIGDTSAPNAHDGLRMRVVSETVREIEFGSGEVQKFELENDVWRLKQMRDRFDNAVNISYTYSSDGKRELTWAITDTASRSHTVTLDNYPGMADGWSRGQMVSTLDLQGFGGATATYSLGYSAGSWPALTTLNQPDGTAYNFTGSVSQIRYPTGGTVSYTYGDYGFGPQDSICALAISSGVKTRTVSDGSTTRIWDYQEQMGYRVAATSSFGVPCGFGDGSLNGPFYWTRTSVVAPADASNNRVRTDHYFSTFTDAPGDGMGFTVNNPLPAQGLQAYSHPGAIGVPPADHRPKLSPGVLNGDVDSRDENTSSARLLSTEIYSGCDSSGDCTNGTLQRTRYERYTGTVTPKPLQGHAFDDTRLLSSRTVFNDDAGCGGGTTPCYTQTTNSDDNGAMQFRQTTLESNFPGAQTVTTRTEHPPWTSTDLSDFTKPWLLNVYTEKTRAENSVTAHEQFCFDTAAGSASTGVLLRHRVLGGSVPLANDVLTVFDYDTSGNVQYISSYGGDQSPRSGDSQTLGTQTNLCSASLPAHPAYKTKQTFTNGILASSQYHAGDTGQALSFKSVDRDIDASTGVVTAARDTTGLVATFLSYSAKPARLESMTLPTGATTTYTYTNAAGTPGSGFTPAKVHSETPSSSAGTVKQEFVFDGLGRVFRQSHLGPQSNWFATETTFDEAGRTASVSQPESTGVNPPSDPLTAAHKTTYKYDSDTNGHAVVVITPPDNTTTNNTTTSTVYQGSRIRTKTSRIQPLIRIRMYPPQRNTTRTAA